MASACVSRAFWTAFDVDAADAERMIMRARVAAGWISEDDLPVEEVPAEEAAPVEEMSEEELEAEAGEFDLAALEAEAERPGRRSRNADQCR